MLDQYSAEGFGVMVSAPIDATLYDKLDGVCGKRGIAQMHFSALELERAVARSCALGDRYFGVPGETPAARLTPDALQPRK
jgi:hypothetical protein